MAAIPILVIAVVQGWLLYGLHYSLDHKTWPATHAAGRRKSPGRPARKARSRKTRRANWSRYMYRR